MKKANQKSNKKAEELRKLAEKTFRKRKIAVKKELSQEDTLRLIHEFEIHQIELEMQNEELRRIQAELEKSREDYSDLFNYAPVGYFMLNVNGLITEVNLSGASMLQVGRGLLVNKTFSRFVHDHDKDAFYLHYRQLLKTVKQQSIDLRLKRKDGSVFFVHMKCLPVYDSSGSLCQVRMVIMDITERRQIEENILSVNAEWERTFDTIPDIIMIIDDQCIIKKANKALSERLGIDRDELIGRKCYSVVHGTNAPPSSCPHSLALSLEQEQIAEGYEDRLKGHFMLSSSPVYGADGKKKGVVAVWRDISSRKEMEEKLRASSITDELTGLLNRRGFLTLAEQQCKIANRSNKFVSLVFIDLDGMKRINDIYGHKEGDRALRNVSRIMKSTFRESDICGRIGGDEFAVLLTEPSRQDMEGTIMNHIDNNIRLFNKQNSRGYDLSLTLGVASSDPASPCSLDKLLISADYAMYQNKRPPAKLKQTAALSEGMDERRSMDRCNAGDCRVDIIGSDTIRVKNISTCGICLSNMDNIMTKQFQAMKVASSKESMSVKGIMVWSKLTDMEDYEAGLKFIGLNDKNKKSLAKIISDYTQ